MLYSLLSVLFGTITPSLALSVPPSSSVVQFQSNLSGILSPAINVTVLKGEEDWPPTPYEFAVDRGLAVRILYYGDRADASKKNDVLESINDLEYAISSRYPHDIDFQPLYAST